MYVIRRMSDELDDILKRYGTFESLEDAKKRRDALCSSTGDEYKIDHIGDIKVGDVYLDPDDEWRIVEINGDMVTVIKNRKRMRKRYQVTIDEVNIFMNGDERFI